MFQVLEVLNEKHGRQSGYTESRIRFWWSMVGKEWKPWFQKSKFK